MKDEIIESIARTLFVCAFTDACEDEEIPDEDIDRSQAAGSGEDWFDTVTDETPEAAKQTARHIVSDFQARNKRTIESAGEEWTALEFYYAPRKNHNSESFGHYVAMTYLGHGVGLWDDYLGEDPPGFECSSSEFYLNL